MRKISFYAFLIILLAIIHLTQQQVDYPTLPIYQWNLINTLVPQGTSSNFGCQVDITEEVAVVGDNYGKTATIFRNNGSSYNFEKILAQPTITSFGSSVSTSQNVTVVGAFQSNQVFVYRYNGSEWNMEQNFSSSNSSSYFGQSVYVDGNLLFIGDTGLNQVSIYEFKQDIWRLKKLLADPNASNYGGHISYSDNFLVFSETGIEVFVYEFGDCDWNLKQNLSNSSLSNFGSSTSISGNTILVGENLQNSTSIYQFNGTYWNLQQTLDTQIVQLGYSVSVSENFTLLGTLDGNHALVYLYNGSQWISFADLTQPSSVYFGSSVAISPQSKFAIISDPHTQQAFVYQITASPSKIHLINCSSLFSKFQCFWQKMDFPLPLDYQINYGFGWISIQSPISNGNVFLQQFDLLNYPNITGNSHYSIQIRACDNSTSTCGTPSSSFDLTTRIDSVKNLSLVTPQNDSVVVTWNHPNVAMDGEVPHLDHYVISYQNQTGNPTNISVSNSSTSFKLQNLGCQESYNISMWACRTSLCEGDDQGEVVGSFFSTVYNPVSNFQCSVSTDLIVNCTWNPPFDCSSPFSYNFSYEAISQNDSSKMHVFSPTKSSFSVKFQDEQYSVQVSACDSNNVCGEIANSSITSPNLTTPIILHSISQIESIELNFTKLPQFVKYLISIDNSFTWENFTTLNSTGNEMIGTKNGLSGNVEYLVSIRGCSNLSCDPKSLGLISSTISITPKLGTVPSFQCVALISGFQCDWDSLNSSIGLKAYGFIYNSQTICLSTSTTSFSISNLTQGETYHISIFASADSNCSFDMYSGINSTTSITTLSHSTQANTNSSKTTAIVIGIVVPVVVISLLVLLFVFIKKKRNQKKKQNSESQDKEFHDLDI